jgi:uncharacterized protein (DUF1778 family)
MKKNNIETKTERFELRITKTQRAALEELAAQNKQYMSETIRSLFDYAISHSDEIKSEKAK